MLGPLDHFTLSVVPSTPTAGVSFTVQATAKDAAGDTLGAYNAAATWSDTSGLLAPVSPNNFANGVSTTNATISLPYPGDQITLSSGGQSSSTSSFDVLGPLDHFTFSVALTTPTAGVSFTVQATAKDAAGDTLGAYNAAATWSDLSGVLAPASPSAFVNGVSTTNATVGVPYHGDQITLMSGGQSSSTSSFDVLGL